MPILKSGNNQTFGNNRAISLLSVFAKLLEYFANAKHANVEVFLNLNFELKNLYNLI